MRTQTKEAYAEVFSCLIRKWEELGVKPIFEAYHMDYEGTEISAGIEAFGLNVSVMNLLLSFYKEILENTRVHVSLHKGCPAKYKIDWSF